MYEYIINPTTNRNVSVYGKIGKKIINNYINILNGGAAAAEVNQPPALAGKKRKNVANPPRALAVKKRKIAANRLAGKKRKMVRPNRANRPNKRKKKIVNGGAAVGKKATSLVVKKRKLVKSNKQKKKANNKKFNNKIKKINKFFYEK